MSEYIVDWDENLVIDTFSKNSLREEIVRCRDCKWFLADEVYGDACRWFCRSNDNPDGFCKWGERETNNKTGEFATHDNRVKGVDE